MNAKKAKQLRKVANSLIKSDTVFYEQKQNGELNHGKMTRKGIIKELRKTFK